MGPLLEHDPARVGPFRLIGRLGTGGMGVVYAGVSKSGERVAVKVVHPGLADDPIFRVRFAREIALLRRINGACTVALRAADPDAPAPWFATEYVPGPTLAEHVRVAGPLSGDELFGVASGLAEGLVAMHAAGVVHRDLKPANVILSPSGPRVVDLGIARAVDDSGATRTGVLFGSPAWLSPEHYREEEVGPASDMHAWGLVMVFAATGRPPFGRGRPDVLAARVLRDDPDLTGVDPGLRGIVGAALAKDPAKRPAAAEALAAVTGAWRERTGRDTAGPSDAGAATELIHQTWVMPAEEDPAWSRAGAGIGPGRRLRLAGIALAVIALVSAIAAGLAATRGTGVPAALDGTPTPGGSATARTRPGERVYLEGGGSAVVPAGWAVRSGTDDVGPYLCLLAPGHRGSGCMDNGVLIQTWTGDRPDLADPQLWTGGGDPSDLPQCYTRDGDDAPGITSAAVTAADQKQLGNRSAQYREYQVTCGPRVAFSPRVWWLPRAHLMVTVVALPDRYRTAIEQIAASVRARQ